MPLYRRLPKRGFNRIGKKNIAILNISDISSFLKSKRSNLKDKIDIKYLAERKIIGKKYSKLKILGKGELSEKINIATDFISKSAKSKVEKAGGSIVISKLKNI